MTTGPLQPTPEGDTILDDQDARLLLTPAISDPSRVWAYAAAAHAPGAAPVDEILFTETNGTGADMGVVWVRHPGSYTGATGHLVTDTTGNSVNLLLRRWEHLVFELADLVEHHADPTTADDGGDVIFTVIQAAHLRWAAGYGVTVALCGIARDAIRDILRDQLGGGLDQDLGDLSPEDAAHFADGTTDGPITPIPPGWDLSGWDHTRLRTHPILTGLR
ncbi:hypothetical protein [Actinomadura macra]|uniref:hypothetical protein n=1 Tax=Actinomadura macra TaxID=46164 RepID=UPI00082E544A|nr:hypothetical protein [Actinomadura macra]